MTVLAVVAPAAATFSLPPFSTITVRPSGVQSTAVGIVSPEIIVCSSKEAG